MIKILFVCMGNICRSPTAEGVFRHQVAQAGLSNQFLIDSAGTHAYHIDEAPDVRSQSAASQRGFDLSQQMSRQVNMDDFAKFDYIISMDKYNDEILKNNCPSEHRAKLHLFMDFAENNTVEEVPDPWSGGHKGFDIVLNLVEEASTGLLKKLKPS